VRILINDFENYRNEYIEIFVSFGYEKNELIFCQTFEQTKDFIVNQLEKNKLHIDLIITNDSNNGYSANLLKSSELAFFIRSLTTSFSKKNFRISSIPLILYSKNETKLSEDILGFNRIIQKNTLGNHQYFINQCERAIKNWRKSILEDLDILDIPIESLHNFIFSKYYQIHYSKRILNCPEYHFAHSTSIVSLEFIRCPQSLNYDWLSIKEENIEEALEKYSETYKRHKKYDRRNNERTILHKFFNENKIILLRDTFVDIQYETNLYEANGVLSEECDFILKTDFPEYLNTTFFEVKKEDVKFFSNVNRKRPSLNRKFQDHLDQIWQYKKFSQNESNYNEIEYKLGYRTNHFDYVLLAGRDEEKAEFQELFQEKMKDHYDGITVMTFEELEDTNVNYLNKFSRLKFY
jgi:hypothetical protein